MLEEEKSGLNVCTSILDGGIFPPQWKRLAHTRTLCLAKYLRRQIALCVDSADGRCFLVRNGSVFGLILEYLQTGGLVMPRDPLAYTTLRRELGFYGPPILSQLPQVRPREESARSVHCHHAHIVVKKFEKHIECSEGHWLPFDPTTPSLLEIVGCFAEQGVQGRV